MQKSSHKVKPYKLILLDRDGVLNKDLATSVRSLQEFKIIPSSLEAVAHLSQQGLKIAVVTNQAVVGRGELSRHELEKIHAYLQQEIQKAGGHIDKFYVCTGTEVEPHKRRKPAPGMLLEALDDFNVPPQETLMIGDALRDLQAAKSACVESILVRTGKGEKTEKDLPKDITPLGIYDDLYQAVLKNFP